MWSLEFLSEPEMPFTREYLQHQRQVEAEVRRVKALTRALTDKLAALDGSTKIDSGDWAHTS